MCLLVRIPAVRVSEGRVLRFFLLVKYLVCLPIQERKIKVIVPSGAVYRSNQIVLLEEVYIEPVPSIKLVSSTFDTSFTAKFAEL